MSRAENRADKMDTALIEGGSLAAIGAALNVTERDLRRHIRRRVATGNWRFHPTATARKTGGWEVPTAGYLRKLR